jgi:fatty acid desaturase
MSSLIEPGRPALPPAPDRSSAEWEQARKRLEKKNKLRGDLVAYVVINLALIGVWAITGGGYFWPGWVLGGWAVFLLLDAWNVYFRRPVTEEDIDREVRKQR